jgi:lipid II:glycine glycyltransferase (peptidoglycan interpeptide bridge formation enzyme)
LSAPACRQAGRKYHKTSVKLIHLLFRKKSNMIYRKPREDEKRIFDHLALHPLQSWPWGSFREQTGVEVERLIGFEGSESVAQIQVTFHPIPKLGYTVGYYPKGQWPDEILLDALKKLGKRKRALFVKLEPNVSSPPKNEADISGLREFLIENGCEPGRALFTPYSFVIDLSKNEDELLAQMKPKTRYNVRLAEKNGVTVTEDTSDAGFEEYMKLLKLTTSRQGFYAHSENYQRQMWQAMNGAGMARILKATYQGQTLVVWILFQFNYSLYYPYGASSRDHRDKMASNLIMWEAIKLGKRLNCRTFDLWGSLGPNPNPKDPWFGFHKFKEGYGGDLVQFVGSYDLVVEPQLYRLYRIADRWRWRYLRLKHKLPFLP